mmetsp:Transcript_16434/g.20526  ORF Transcript_16434/g.20526 Transcript_16434/m.20526 type:complete len:201 (+) Transcript_16434:1223-1825(+)
MYVNCPNGVSSSLKASARSGSSSLPVTFTGSSFLVRSRAKFSFSCGSGRNDTTPSSSGCTPLFLNAEPINTGTNARAMVCRRIASRSWSSVGVSSIKNNSAMSSSASATRSISSSLFSSTVSIMLSGMSPSVTVSPFAPSNTRLFIAIKSITPVWRSSSPMGTCTAAAFKFNDVLKSSTTLNGLEPCRSNLLMNATRGTP